jgi:hypothetical protein
MQIWSVEWYGEQFKFKTVYNGPETDAWQQFYYLTAHSMSVSSKSELWLIEEDANKVFHTKAKFKWEKH